MFRLFAKSSAKLLSPLWQSLKSTNFEVSSNKMRFACVYALFNLDVEDIHRIYINYSIKIWLASGSKRVTKLEYASSEGCRLSVAISSGLV